MSDYRVIGGVTQALVEFVQQTITYSRSAVSHAGVTASRPDAPEQGDDPRVNIYLFHVQPNASLRNIDLPTLSGGNYVQKPTIALDLYYLFSFYGTDQRNRLESQLLMGLTMGAMHARPYISPEELKNVLADDQVAETGGQSAGKIEYNEVTLAIESMSIHELSRLWQTFPQVPLVLSTAYRATTVLVSEEVDLKIPKPLEYRDFTLIRHPVAADKAAAQTSPENPTKPVKPATFRQAIASRFSAFRGHE